MTELLLYLGSIGMHAYSYAITTLYAIAYSFTGTTVGLRPHWVIQLTIYCYIG